ncbi:MAG: DUF2835 family protein [Pseudomonadota bacterium]
MKKYEFRISLSAAEIETVYRGQARYIQVSSMEGLKLQLPAANFRQFVTAAGIQGRFLVEVDANNKLRHLNKISG